MPVAGGEQCSIGFQPVPRDHCAWPSENGNDAGVAPKASLNRCRTQAGSLCYIGFYFMESDFQAIQIDELKSRIGELRRYL